MERVRWIGATSSVEAGFLGTVRPRNGREAKRLHWRRRRRSVTAALLPLVIG